VRVPQPSSRTALIVGAGIGGLSAGLALRRAGWNIRIFERAASLRELGFGVGLAPNAIAALRELGLADVVLARSCEPRRVEVRRLDGTVLKRAELPLEVRGGPMVVALRPALHGALVDAVGADAISVDSHVTGFEATDNKITLEIAGRAGVSGDLVIGADGVGSVIRRQMHPEEGPPRSSRLVAVRGAVHGALQYLQNRDAVCYLGRGVEAMVVRASETGIYWFVSLSENLIPSGLRQPADILALMSPRFDAMFRAVTSVTEDLRCDELVDRDPLPSWGAGRVTLLGDAAHPLLPQTGQGAAQAMVDAVALGKLLGEGVRIADALAAYGRARRPKAARLLAQGRRTARIMGTTNPLACWIRERVVRSIPIKPLMKLYVRGNRRAGTDVTGTEPIHKGSALE
jgi:2-polyprenyl-6-methoxyphenol hydroxylase-like FAD-dependent oxidoreductase